MVNRIGDAAVTTVGRIAAAGAGSSVLSGLAEQLVQDNVRVGLLSDPIGAAAPAAALAGGLFGGAVGNMVCANLPSVSEARALCLPMATRPVRSVLNGSLEDHFNAELISQRPLLNDQTKVRNKAEQTAIDNKTRADELQRQLVLKEKVEQSREKGKRPQ